MLDRILESMERARNLLDKGKFQQILEILDGYDKSKLSPSEYLNWLLLKTELFLKIDKFQEGLEWGIQANEQAILAADRISEFTAKSLLSELNIRKNNFEEASRLLNKSRLLLNSNQLNNKIRNRFQARIFWLEAFSSWQQGDLDQGLRFINDSFELYEEFGTIKELGDALGLFGILECEIGDFEEGKIYIEEAIKIQDDLGNSNTKSKLLNNLGWVCCLRGDLDQSKQYINEAITIMSDLGINTRTEESNLGTVYRMSGDFQNSLKYYKKSLEKSKIIANSREIGLILFEQFLVFMEMKDISNAKNNFKKIQKMKIDDPENLIIQRILEFSEAMLLMENPGIQNFAKAQELLNQITESEIVFQELTIYALLYQVELRLIELRISNDPKIMKELQDFLHHLLLIARDQHNYTLWVKIYFIQAKLALVKLDIISARQFLTQAQNQAEKQGLYLLARKISAEHDKILEQMNIWESFTKESSSFGERLELSNLENHVSNVFWQREFKDESSNSTFKKEMPIGFFILGDEGNVIYAHSFSSKWHFDDQLIGGFLTAFNAVTSDIFSSPIDRAKFGEYYILLSKIHPLIFCYVFKGKTYLAKQRLVEFQRKIHDDSKLFNDLINYNQKLDVNEQEVINAEMELILGDVF
ncbi:MAG: tetratricopeptide repeat protein [Promethearchaeota archaeon]